MHTIICTQPGQLSFCQTKLRPRKQGETLLHIKAIGVCGTDIHAYAGVQPFFSYPRILGHEIAAEIMETEREGFSAGDKVTISPYFYCGTCIACKRGFTNCCSNISVFGVHEDGGMRQQIIVPDHALVAGYGLDFDELALVEPLAIGAHGVRRANILQGEYVLIIGAGPIGIAAALSALQCGSIVIIMDVNQNRLEFCSTLPGLQYFINPSTEDTISRLSTITGGDMPTVVIDASGSLKAIQQGFMYAAHSARYVLIGLQRESISFSHPEFHKREMTLMSSRNATSEDFDWVLGTIKAKRIEPRKLITRKVSAYNRQDVVSLLEAKDNSIVKSIMEW